jgi:hypothetical protein
VNSSRSSMQRPTIVNYSNHFSFEFVIGYPSLQNENSLPYPCQQLDNSCFGLYFFDNTEPHAPASVQFVYDYRAYGGFAAGVLPQVFERVVDHNPSPTLAAPDLEWSITDFNAVRRIVGLPPIDFDAIVPWQFNMKLFGGSFDDDGIGEAYWPHHRPVTFVVCWHTRVCVCVCVCVF